MLFYKVGPSPSTWWGMVMTSADGGRTWSEPRRLPDGMLGPIKNKPVQLANGDILSGSSTEHDGWRVHFERSSDNGATWTAHAAAQRRQGDSGHPAEHPRSQGRASAGDRPQPSKRLFETWSSDQGTHLDAS